MSSEEALGTAGLSRATLGMTVGTLLSRITGFGRIVALAYALGLGPLADTYNLANTTPNIIYDLVLGGVLSAFIVPVFVDQLASGDDDRRWEAISAVVTAALAVLTVATALFAVFAPAIFRIYTLSRHGEATADQLAVGTFWLRCFAPQVLFYGVAALATGLLNARRRFFWPMATPVVNNLVVIAIFLALPRLGRDLTLGGAGEDTGLLLLLGLGTTAGVVAQALLLGPSLRRAGVRLRLIWAPSHPLVRRVVRLSGWTLGYVLANQVSLWVALALANGRTGDVSAYLYAYAFFQLPYGVLAVSILTALTPDLAERWTVGDRTGYRERLGLGLRVVAIVMVPAGAGYALLARPILDLLLRHGATVGVGTTAGTLALLAIGLPAFSVYLLLMRGYTATQDTRTPFLVNCLQNALTIAFDLALYPVMGAPGLALGFTLAYVVGAVVTAFDLRRRAGGLDGAAVLSTTARVGAATAVMAAAVAALDRLVPGSEGPALAGRLVVAMGAGVSVYALTARAMGVRELDVVGRLRRRPAGAGP